MPHRDALPTLAYDELTGALQHALAALADIEFEFHSACERLDEWSGSEANKDRFRQQLEAERCRRREPLIRHLDELDRLMKAFVFSWSPSEWQAPADLERPVHASQVLV